MKITVGALGLAERHLDVNPESPRFSRMRGFRVGTPLPLFCVSVHYRRLRLVSASSYGMHESWLRSSGIFIVEIVGLKVPHRGLPSTLVPFSPPIVEAILLLIPLAILESKGSHYAHDRKC